VETLQAWQATKLSVVKIYELVCSGLLVLQINDDVDPNLNIIVVPTEIYLNQFAYY